MKVIVKWKNHTRTFNIEYNVGDIVKIVDYGSRWASQKKIFLNTTFPIRGVPFDAENEIIETDYATLNVKYSNLAWKIVDIGYYVMEGNTDDKLLKSTLVIRLRDRERHEMLFVYDSYDSTHDMVVIRKAKKQLEEYIINLD